MKTTPKYLYARYMVLTQLAANAGLYAGKQGQNYDHQERSLWEWAARILDYDLAADEPRYFWREAFLHSYELGRQSTPATKQHDHDSHQHGPYRNGAMFMD